MPNKRYSDVNPKESAKGGMKNVDAREEGAAWNTDHTPGPIKTKLVVDPNESNPSLGHVPGAEGGH